MENIEQLKQDNAKLTERLNNAAKFFREQKAQIEALTKENEELKAQINRTPQEEIISTEDWNKLVTEKENLKKQIEGYENERKSNEAYSDDLNKQCDKYELKVQELEKNIESKDKAYKVLQDTYNEVFAELEQFKKKYQARKEKEVELLKTIEDNKLDYDKLNKEHKALNDTYNKLNNEYSDIYTKYNDLEQGRIKSEEQLNALNTLCIQYKEDNKELQDKFDNLEKICNDFENQKLAADADYQGILDMYQELQKEYERLRNERDIYSQSDDALAEIAKILIEKGLVNKNDLTPQTAIKESGTAHRMGDSLEGGKNVGV
jgi:chromosome segregation ATPase